MSAKPIGEIYTLYLKAAHLKPGGVEVAITKAEYEELHPVAGSDQVKPAIVLSFKNATRKLALNQTQAGQMIEITGSEDWQNVWPGHVVKLVPVQLNKKQSTIRIERPATVKPNGGTK